MLRNKSSMLGRNAKKVMSITPNNEEKLKQEKLEQEKLEQEKLEQEKLEQEKLQREKLQKEDPTKANEELKNQIFELFDALIPVKPRLIPIKPRLIPIKPQVSIKLPEIETLPDYAPQNPIINKSGFGQMTNSKSYDIYLNQQIAVKNNSDSFKKYVKDMYNYE